MYYVFKSYYVSNDECNTLLTERNSQKIPKIALFVEINAVIDDFTAQNAVYCYVLLSNNV